jgi:hypothetical protein
MLTRTVIVVVCALSLYSQSYSADPLKGSIYIADGTANLKVVAKVTDAATHKPVAGATVTAVRSGRGTTLLLSDSTAMPPPVKTDRHGHATLHANFRWAGVSSRSSVFVARSFLRVQAPTFHSIDAPISAIGRLDFAPKAKHYQVTIPIALAHE